VALDLSRLLRPKSIALFGGSWAVNVIAQLQNSGFEGEIWPVHPTRNDLLGVKCYRSLDDLPHAPDASFIGVNREATIEIVQKLSAMGAGGATCFASGFLESDGEAAGGAALQMKLVEAAGSMPVLGPNCYGLLNYLDNICLWPDQHGGEHLTPPADRGVGIIAQSSNIAINMTMQQRGLPIGYVLAAGNQAQTGVSDLANALLEDPRVSAIGLYLEGFGNIRALEAFAAKARKANKPVVVLKIGRSQKAQLATLTHTASLAGNAAVSSALIKRLGFIEVHSISVFLETLKLLHFVGPLEGNEICSVSCSGGEASLMADLCDPTPLNFRDFSPKQASVLKKELGPIVTVANPLDYHTFIWGDVAKMSDVFSAVMADNFDLCVFVLDIPRADKCDPSSFDCAIEAIIAAKLRTGVSVAVLSCLPENLSELVIEQFSRHGIVCLNGMEEGLGAIVAAAKDTMQLEIQGEPVLLSQAPSGETETLDEAQSKEALRAFDVQFPKASLAKTIHEIEDAANGLNFPLVLKGVGIAHKSEAGAVTLNLGDVSALTAAAENMPASKGYLIEEMVGQGVAELIVGVTRDASGLFLLTLGAGGVLAELLKDTQNILLPTNRSDIKNALEQLGLHSVLQGYRGKPAADLEALIDQVAKIAKFAEAHCDRLVELDINPIIAGVDRAIAVDALIRLETEGN